MERTEHREPSVLHPSGAFCYQETAWRFGSCSLACCFRNCGATASAPRTRRGRPYGSCAKSFFRRGRRRVFWPSGEWDIAPSAGIDPQSPREPARTMPPRLGIAIQILQVVRTAPSPSIAELAFERSAGAVADRYDARWSAAPMSAQHTTACPCGCSRQRVGGSVPPKQWRPDPAADGMAEF